MKTQWVRTMGNLDKLLLRARFFVVVRMILAAIIGLLLRANGHRMLSAP